MLTSQETDQIATALAAVQGEIHDPKKDRQGYGYSYADLASVLEIARPVMARHGVVVVQSPEDEAPLVQGEICIQRVRVVTRLAHTSGQWYESSYSMAVEPKKGLSGAQCLGSTITYARRYALAALLGMAQVDDDAEIPDTISADDARALKGRLVEAGINIDKVVATYHVERIEDLTKAQHDHICKTLESKKSQATTATENRGAALKDRLAAEARRGQS